MTTYTNDIYGVQQQIADEKAKSERDFLADSYNLASVQGGMMLANARDIGRSQGDVYANLGRMLTGEEEAVDPRLVRMQKLQEIMEQVPEPDTYDEYIKLAGLMNKAELYGEATEAMKMANEIKSSMPTPAYTTGKIGIMKDGRRYTQTWQFVDGKKTTLLGEQLTDAPTEVDLDTQVYEANLVPYMEAAMAELETNNPRGLSGVELTKEARKMAQREYSKVTDAADLADNSTTFTKNFDFFRSQMDGEEHIYSVAESIAKATSLDRETVDEANQKLQDDAVLEAQKTMSADLSAAQDELRTSTQMLGILDKIDTGVWSNVMHNAALWLGVETEDVANKEMFFSLSIKKVMDYTNMTKGAISDAEMALFRAAAPSLAKTTAGNRLLLRFAEEGAKAQIRVAKHMRLWKSKQVLANGDRRPISFNEWEMEKNRFIESAENSAQFADITNSEEWIELTAVGNSLNVSTNIKADLFDANSEIGSFCAKNPGAQVCINLNRQFN